MNKKGFFFIFLKIFLIFFLLQISTIKSWGEKDISELQKQVESLQKDIQTLEKAVYSSDKSNQSTSSYTNEEDVLTRHLLKLSEIEEQFQNLTNKFEEINFKIDKLSNRITKTQKDNQMRFQDLEQRNLEQAPGIAQKEKLPGTDMPQDLGNISDDDIIDTQQVQKTQSIESVGTVLTEEAQRIERILPDKNPAEQYEFAISFIRIGDYETAEVALREFVDINSKHKLAGNAQYWYGETFRIRQLYQDAAMAYLDGYQKYPKSEKAPLNLLKLGVTLVQIGEKDQGCIMILGVENQYPKASQSVLQKAKYEKKKFDCNNKES